VRAASRLISFRIQQFGTVALIQDAHVNMPFQSWELRPRTTNHAQLTIIAAVVEVEIQIKVRAVSSSQLDLAKVREHAVGLGTWSLVVFEGQVLDSA